MKGPHSAAQEPMHSAVVFSKAKPAPIGPPNVNPSRVGPPSHPNRHMPTHAVYWNLSARLGEGSWITRKAMMTSEQ